jgi:hypothetical protein
MKIIHSFVYLVRGFEAPSRHSCGELRQSNIEK